MLVWDKEKYDANYVQSDRQLYKYYKNIDKV